MNPDRAGAPAAAGKARFWSLTFSPETEALYRAYNFEQNYKQVAVSTFVGALLVDSFIISDFIVAREYIILFLIGRFLVMTPPCLVVAALIWKRNPYYELWTIIAPVIMTITVSGFIFLAEGDFRPHYVFGNLLVIVGGCVLTRPRMNQATIAVMLQFVIYVFVVQHADFISEPNKITYILYGTGGVVISLLAVYTQETTNRRSFLLGRQIELLNRDLEAQSLTDPLTQLANRRAFERATALHWGDPASRSEPVSLVLIDVDRFKLFNDTYGHAAGDRCLTRLTRCVAAQMPDDRGLAVRFGGEELLLFLPATDFTQARAVAERARLAILREAIPHPVDGGAGVVSASFGIATATAGDCDATELVIRADTALYAAKAGGRNQVWPPLGQAAGEHGPQAALARGVA